MIDNYFIPNFTWDIMILFFPFVFYFFFLRKSRVAWAGLKLTM